MTNTPSRTEYFMEMRENSVGAFHFSTLFECWEVSCIEQTIFLLELFPSKLVVVNLLDMNNYS
jgi:hypothetical protein